MDKIDFHDLINNDPDNFERIVREHIESKLIEIADGDEQKLWKLKKLQNSIDKEMDKYHNPITRLNKMVEIFYSGLNEFNEALQEFKKKMNNE